ncbi:HipA family kinase [Chondromyces crocatus]|uniref:HipA family kinase n=1 Tax=Chondromyces crocatus TaxID=52 RepID=UPI00067AFF02
MRTVQTTRYVTPLREGGSLPALVEGDDDGMYVLKFRGAGQGPKALIAELVAGELARALALPVPELVFMTLDARFGDAEPDPDIADLLSASTGLNLALDFLPGALPYQALAGAKLDPALAAAVVWFDAFVSNVDRTVRNPNLLLWHKQLWLIDHGAALYVHHAWTDEVDPREDALDPSAFIKQHVLLPYAGDLAAADAMLAPRLTKERIEAIVAMIPDAWLEGAETSERAAARRAGYAGYLERRLESPRRFVEEAIRAQARR